MKPYRIPVLTKRYLLTLLFILLGLLIFFYGRPISEFYSLLANNKINVDLNESNTLNPMVLNHEEYLYSCLNELTSKGNMDLMTQSGPKELERENLSKCNEAASKRGPHQKVVSFSFYGKANQDRNYFKGIEENAKLMGKIYPKWIMRLYHDIPPLTQNTSISKYILNEFHEGTNSTAATLKGSQGNMWRFLPMADPLVDVFLSRDLDSRINEREKAAVDDWLSSNLTFHIMRDHPYHMVPILAGMWGAVTYRDREKLKNLTQILMNEGKIYLQKDLDQILLKKILWPVAKGVSKQHDSYHCNVFKKHGNMTPWPTERSKEPYNFVGSRIGTDIHPLQKKCPVQCHPRNGKHWIYC